MMIARERERLTFLIRKDGLPALGEDAHRLAHPAPTACEEAGRAGCGAGEGSHARDRRRGCVAAESDVLRHEELALREGVDERDLALDTTGGDGARGRRERRGAEGALARLLAAGVEEGIVPVELGERVGARERWAYPGDGGLTRGERGDDAAR
jgi:hypothetical protein